jgi:cytoskeletal protein RodZ
MNERRPFGGQLQRVRVDQGLSVEAAAAKARVTPEQWRALETEDANVYAFTPRAYAAAARTLGMTWTLIYS